MRAMLDNVEGNLAKRIKGIFAVFYINDGYKASCNAEFLQEALNIIVETFKHVGLATKTKKTQAMVCMQGKIRVQLPTDSYRRMCKEVATGEESKRAVVCQVCNKTLQARSLCLHLSSAYDIHKQVVVAEAHWRSGQEPATGQTQGGRSSQYSAHSQDARGCSAAHFFYVGISGIYTQRMLWRSLERDFSHGVSGAQCSATRCTNDISNLRCVCRGRRDGYNGTRQ